jgi:GT2 family glycosyltransferase/lipopolysaccharide/colanic/teichoic acid biosynthesis glycosyltransferase
LKLSVIIVNYNVKYFLEQALASVNKAAKEMEVRHPGWDTDVWVVDNNSVDGSVEMMQSKFPDVNLIANKNNTGFSVANNQAIKLSSGEYVLLLNPDTVVREDTFLRTIEFMNADQDAGGLGVKMIDGKGEFLPESKRGLPSPAVAFFKIFGFSKLFPKSRTFGRYHLGFLSREETHSVDVLAGAFMLLRRKTLDDTGLLDETFFMYGEDIDLSYRIIKAGYKNYYFPGTSIIHYKGESTKKSSVNYVFVFYKAMIIFAKKHFSKNKAVLFSILLNIAIYLRAGISIILRMFGRLLLPIWDFILLYGLMFFLVKYWERTIKYINGGKYPLILLEVFVPLYILGWMLGLLLSGAYRKPFQFRRVFRGVFIGTILIAFGYAFLSENYRFSRGLIVLGAVASIICFLINRMILKALKENSISIDSDDAKKIAIVGKAVEAERITGLLDKTRLLYNLSGFIYPEASFAGLSDHNYIGNISEIEKLIDIYKINELIFCAKDISNGEIIALMEHIHTQRNVDFKIVPENSDFVIGSNSKDKPGDYYSYEVDLAIAKPENNLNKRLFDIVSAGILLISLPINIWFVKNKAVYFSNLFSVMFAAKTWVSYSLPQNLIMKLPTLKPGILNPADDVKYTDIGEATKMRLDYFYAKDYDIYKDISILINGFSKLGNQSTKNEKRNN